MEGNSETLKQQFQALQEQQQKKLQRLKQRKQEKDKKTKDKDKEKENESENGLHIDDDLGLTLAEPVPTDSIYNEELATHLNQQIRELKDENGRLYKLLSERDYEIRKLKKQREETKLAMTGGGIASDTAASRIVELSKKNREMTAEMESEKNKTKQLLRKVNELERELVLTKRQLAAESGGSNTGGNRQQPTKQYTLGDSTLEEKPTVDQGELKALQDKLSQSNFRMAEQRNQIQQLRQELKVAHKVIEKEVGDSVNIPSLLNGTSTWRGRSQQILSLQNKISELKSQVDHFQTRPGTEMSLEEQFMTMGTIMATSPRSASSSVYDDKNRSKIRQMERDRKEAKEKAALEMKAMEEDYGKMKEKFDASKARNKVLTNEVKTLKQQVATLAEKSTHDNELITALMKQQSQMKNIIEENAKLQQEVKDKQQKEVQQLQTKNIQDMGVVEQLKRIVAEKEHKVKILEEEINQMRFNHQRASGGSMVERPPSRGSRPGTVIMSANARPPSGGVIDNRRPGTSDSGTLHSPQPPRNSSRPGSGNRDMPPRAPSRVIRSASLGNVNGGNSSLEQLMIQCQEYKSLGQVAEVERDKLMELVAVLQQRIDKASQNVTESHSQLVQLKQRNVQLEKQLGKARMEVANLVKAPGKKVKSGKSASEVSRSVIMDEDLLRTDLPQTQDNIEELQTRLAIQFDENDALKAALDSTMKAKEDDLRLYHEMMDQTKQVFLQGLRQYRQQNPVS